MSLNIGKKIIIYYLCTDYGVKATVRNNYFDI